MWADQWRRVLVATGRAAPTFKDVKGGVQAGPGLFAASVQGRSRNQSRNTKGKSILNIIYMIRFGNLHRACK